MPPIIIFDFYLKSSMDRFIDDVQYILIPEEHNLKSSMDRFIGFIYNLK